ncbi:MAG: RHS repeat-associated core domain-containing protein, partial [Acidobacteriota bacterium]|nr:RHS repeat-associated core domain-containing protein [Acidobacteriota bacterium]
PNDVTFVYDPAERITLVRPSFTSGPCSDNGTTCLKSFAYDVTANGRLYQAARYNFPVFGSALYVEKVTQTYQYGGLDGRVSRRDTTLTHSPAGGIPSASAAFTQSWVWNDLGQVASETYPTCAGSFTACTGSISRTVSHAYTNGRLTGLPGYTGTVPGQPADVGITYYPNGLISQVAHANGILFTQGKDPNGIARPASFAAVNSGATTLWTTGPYAFDGASNVTQIGGSTFLYDNLSRLTTSSQSLLPTGGGAPAQQSYTFDAFGNIQNITGTSGRSTPTSSATNRLIGPGTRYDTAGNLTSWNGASYGFDAFNQLVQYTNGTQQWLYMYDADDERVWSFQVGASPRFDRWTLRGLDGKVRRTYEVSGYNWSNWAPGSGSLAEDDLYRDGLLLAAYYSDGSRHHYHVDHLGTVRLATNLNGVVTSYHVYHPFGEEATPFNQDGERLKFTGHERDLADPNGPGDDLDYMHARFDSPVTGRFLSTDASQKSADPKSPQSWNRYSYALGNPLKYVDHNGRETALAIGLPTSTNPFGHAAIIINSTVYSYGTNWTNHDRRHEDWGASAQEYLAAQKGKRQTDIVTLKLSRPQEQKLGEYLDANNPNAEGKLSYSVVFNSCVTVVENALIDTGTLPLGASALDDQRPPGTTPTLLPEGIVQDVGNAGLIQSVETVGSPPTPSFTDLLLTTLFHVYPPS